MKTATHLSFHLATFSFLLLLGQAMAQPASCVGKYPMEETVIGNRSKQTTEWCTYGKGPNYYMQIYKWGIHVYELMAAHVGCGRHITVVYTKSDRSAIIYYIPQVRAKFFERSHNKAYRSSHFPCHKVPVQKVLVWKNRAKFALVLKSAVSMVMSMRSTECGGPPIGGLTYTWQSIRGAIARDRIVQAALTFLHGVAFRNSVCV